MLTPKLISARVRRVPFLFGKLRLESACDLNITLSAPWRNNDLLGITFLSLKAPKLVGNRAAFKRPLLRLVALV